MEGGVSYFLVRSRGGEIVEGPDVATHEIIGIYLPYLGPSHPSMAVEAGRALLAATGHDSEGGAWVPVGIGINTGTAFMGTVGSVKGRTDFTAVGDVVNVTARLASLAVAGEILMTESTWVAAGTPPAEHRVIEVKGRNETVSVYSMKVVSSASPA